MYDTVIFDLDGTLLNTLDDLRTSTNYALKANGYPERTLSEIRRFVGNGVRKLIERAVPQGTDVAHTDKVFDDFKKHYDEHCNDETGPYDGIIELLKELKKRGLKTAIVSNKIQFAVEKLDEIYFKGLIDVAAGVEEGKPTKPDAYMVDKIISKLGTDKKKVLYVGDSQVDVQTAKNAGLNMVTVLWGFRDKDELIEAGATHFIEKPMELLKFL